MLSIQMSMSRKNQASTNLAEDSLWAKWGRDTQNRLESRFLIILDDCMRFSVQPISNTDRISFIQGVKFEKDPSGLAMNVSANLANINGAVKGILVDIWKEAVELSKIEFDRESRTLISRVSKDEEVI